MLVSTKFGTRITVPCTDSTPLASTLGCTLESRCYIGPPNERWPHPSLALTIFVGIFWCEFVWHRLPKLKRTPSNAFHVSPQRELTYQNVKRMYLRTALQDFQSLYFFLTSLSVGNAMGPVLLPTGHRGEPRVGIFIPFMPAKTRWEPLLLANLIALRTWMLEPLVIPIVSVGETWTGTITPPGSFCRFPPHCDE